MKWCQYKQYEYPGVPYIPYASLMHLTQYIGVNYPYYQMQKHYQERIYHEILRHDKTTQSR